MELEGLENVKLCLHFFQKGLVLNWSTINIINQYNDFLHSKGIISKGILTQCDLTVDPGEKKVEEMLLPQVKKLGLDWKK